MIYTTYLAALGLSVCLLNGSGVKQFDKEMAHDLDRFIPSVLKDTSVPGVSVAVVQGGKVVYARGFGVRELGKSGRVTPETLMMIGSTGKSMTTLMMASAIDDGKFNWETKVKDLYPGFAVGDPGLTDRLTMRDMACMCTGIEGSDLGLLFGKVRKEPNQVIKELASFKKVADFGKSFEYVNEMVAAGGYIAAHAAEPRTNDLLQNYLRQIQRRVYDPIKMRATTFSFEKVLRTPDHAMPHGRRGDMRFVPISTNAEKELIPLSPAGASWSNVRDMARYVLTQLNRGISPDGKRVVSSKNLLEIWIPRVTREPGAYYAMGWGGFEHSGHRVLTHSGGTLGFSSDVTFLPEDGYGLVILTNGQSASALCVAIRRRAIALILGEDVAESAALLAELHAAKDRAGEIAKRLAPEDPADRQFAGVYLSDQLGRIQVSANRSGLSLDVGRFKSQLRSLGNSEFVLWDPPLAGTRVHFYRAPDGRRHLKYVADPNEAAAPIDFRELAGG